MPRDRPSPWLRMADALLAHEVEKIKEKLRTERPCPHPIESVVQGRNQYGEWDRCLRCRTKIAYRPHSVKPEKKVKGRDIVYVPTTKAPFEPKRAAKAKAPPAEAASSSQQGISPEIFQSALMETNQQMISGMTSVLSQAISPLMSGQQALLEMTQQSMNNQTLLMQTVQQSQGAIAQAMTEMTQQMRRERDDEEWDEVPQVPQPGFH